MTLDPVISVESIWLPNDSATQPRAFEQPYEPITLDILEHEHIAKTLEFTNWNKSHAATILGIERSTLDRKIKRYNITPKNSDQETAESRIAASMP